MSDEYHNKNSNRVYHPKSLQILQIGAPQLTEKSRELNLTEISSEKIQNLIDDMIHTCHLDIDKTAGLAAPQIGENVQITIIRRVDVEEKEKSPKKKLDSIDLWQELINPEIISTDPDGEESMIWEACLSIGEGPKQLWGPVWRPRRVKIKFLDRFGNENFLEADGFFSHLIQHEIDHLQGILFTKYVKNPEQNLWLSKDFDEYLSKYGEYPNIR
jgi:peptide deformylase